MSEFESLLKSYQARINHKLEGLLPMNDTLLSRAMRYSVLNGGKRLRPMLVYLIGELSDTESKYLDTLACSVELIHCYSLIHDDLPAMDDDDLRRGNPTTHKKFDEATAILVGDALQSLAFEILANHKTHKDSKKRIMLINELSKSAGCQGMVGGQMLDLEAEKKKLNLKEIYNLQRLKTGELFRFSCVSPCILAGKNNKIKMFENFSSNLGLAFQIKDDLLDIEGNEKEIGKKTRKDSRKVKRL